VGAGLWIGITGWILFLVLLMLLRIYQAKPKPPKPSEADRHSTGRPSQPLPHNMARAYAGSGQAEVYRDQSLYGDRLPV
jgi:hypothetical protein